LSAASAAAAALLLSLYSGKNQESVVSTLEVLFGGSIATVLTPLAAACLLVFSL